MMISIIIMTTMATSTRTTEPSFQFVVEGSRPALAPVGVFIGT